MKRTSFWKLLGTLALPLLTLNACSRGAEKPDVLVILIDTLRPDRIGHLGGGSEVSPAIDRWAQESAVFSQAWSTSSWTAPSVASLFTGVFPTRHGVVRGFFANLNAGEGLVQDGQGGAKIPISRMPDDLPTLSELFQEAGYTTLGTASNINIGEEIGFDRGFDRFERNWGGSAEELITSLLSWPELVGDSPRFLYVHLNDVHWPYGRAEGLSPNLNGDKEAVLEAYDGGIRYVDDWVQRLLEGLQLDDDAVIALVSDHGEEFWEHGGTLHGFSVHGELSRILCMLHAPGNGIVPGNYGESVSLLDIAPTLLDLAGIPRPSHLEGRSLLPILQEGPEANGKSTPLRSILRSRPLFVHRLERTLDDAELWGVLEGGWRLIQKPDRYELYRVDEDPLETQDLSGRHPKVVEKMKALIDGVRSGAPTHQALERVDLSDDILNHLKDVGYAH